MRLADAKAFRKLADEFLAQVRNANTQAVYRTGLEGFLTWCEEVDRHTPDENAVRQYLSFLSRSGCSSSTINQRLTSIRRLAGAAAEKGLIELRTAADIARIRGVRRATTKQERNLAAIQTEALINAPDASTRKGLRDRALLATLVGCGLQRNELVDLRVTSIRAHTAQWHLTEVKGRGGRLRNLAVPPWVKEALQAWIQEGAFSEGPIFRRVDRDGTVRSEAISPQSVTTIVVSYARRVGLDVRPDDLRRTCAQLCRAEGGALDEIQMMLGHLRIESTERLLGRREEEPETPNLRLRMKWHRSKVVAS